MIVHILSRLIFSILVHYCYQYPILHYQITSKGLLKQLLDINHLFQEKYQDMHGKQLQVEILESNQGFSR